MPSDNIGLQFQKQGERVEEGGHHAPSDKIRLEIQEGGTQGQKDGRREKL